MAARANTLSKTTGWMLNMREMKGTRMKVGVVNTLQK
jgi:hypothetical protein